MKNLYINEMMTQEHIEQPFDFTLSQLKQLAANGHDIREVTEDLNAQPDWLLSMGGINEVSEIVPIYEGGCASGAFMPAVTYNTALLVMNEHGDDILEFIDGNLGEIPAPKLGESWAGMAVYYTSMAVELWVGGVVTKFELYNLEY